MRYLNFLAGLLLGVLLALGIGANAQLRIGAALGYGETYAREGYSNIESKRNDRHLTEQVYAEARAKYIGIEGGWLGLPEYHSTSHSSDYPAYKGLPAGTYPQTLDGAQDIEASAIYGRLNFYAPLPWFTPYAFLGRARVTTHNYEHPTYNGTDHAEFRQTLRRSANYVGAGVEKNFGSVVLRVEYGRIPHAIVDYHTLDRTMKFGSLGLAFGF